MAVVKAESREIEETISRDVQDKIIALCGATGMDPGNLQILNQVLENFDSPSVGDLVAILGRHSGTSGEIREQFSQLLEGIKV